MFIQYMINNKYMKYLIIQKNYYLYHYELPDKYNNF